MHLLRTEPLTLIETNVVDNAYPTWIATAWSAGSFVVKDEIEYEALSAAEATDIPGENSLIWESKGTINSKAWQDDYVTTKTSRADQIYKKFEAGPGDKLVFFGLEAVQIEIVHTIEDDDIQTYIIDTTEINCGDDPMEFVYGYEDYINDLVVDLNLAFESTIEIYINNPSDTAAVGNIEFGRFIDMGMTLWGAQLGAVDYSRFNTDIYGNTKVVKGIKLKNGEIDVTIDPIDLDRTMKLYLSVTSNRSVIIGDNREVDGYESMIFYGWIRDLMFVLADSSGFKYSAELISSN